MTMTSTMDAVRDYAALVVQLRDRAYLIRESTRDPAVADAETLEYARELHRSLEAAADAVESLIDLSDQYRMAMVVSMNRLELALKGLPSPD